MAATATSNGVSGRTCLITGGAGGLGKSIALELLARGANVAVCDINKATLSSSAAEFSKIGPSLAIQCDITDASAVESLIKQVTKRFGKLDVLVNCAGVMDRFEPTGDVGLELWNKVLTVNLTATYLMSKEALRHFLNRGATDASIINVGSLASERGWCAGAAYTASKHGVMGLTKSTAAFYKSKGVRCNLVMPGGMNTNIVNETPFSHAIHAEGQKLLDVVVSALDTPISDTREVAKLCAFLASTDSSALNGALIKADKGITTII